MSVTVEFPNLGFSFDISRVAFNLFGIDIYWYGVLIAVGAALALLFAFWQAPRFGLDVDRMIDVIVIGFILAIIGGRAYYVLFVDARYRTFFELIDLRSGGIAIYGGIIGAALGAVIGCRWRKVPLAPMLDLTGMGFLIGQSIGRWGNFFNQEAFGSNTTGPFGMISAATTSYLTQNEAWLIERGIFVDPNMPVHPTFLYESLWCAAGFLFLWWYIPRRRFNGEIALFYVMWYGAGRFVIEGLRTDPLFVFGLRVSQVVAFTSFVVALGVWLYARVKTKGRPLLIPEVPPRTAVVKLKTDSGVKKVTISWPANQRTPGAEARQLLAREVLEGEGLLEIKDEDAPKQAKDAPAKEKAEDEDVTEEADAKAGETQDEAAPETADAEAASDSEEEKTDEKPGK